MRQFDQQVVESVALRRQRVRNAVHFGHHRWRHQLQDHIKPLVMGVVFAALIAAGCIAASFVVNLIERQQAEKATRAVAAEAFQDPAAQSADHWSADVPVLVSVAFDGAGGA